MDRGAIFILGVETGRLRVQKARGMLATGADRANPQASEQYLKAR